LALGLALTAAAAGCKPTRATDGAIDCDTEIRYDARKVAGKVDAGKFGASGETSVAAVRQVDEVVERYLSRWKTMCREYNAGVMDKDEYRSEARALRERMEQLDDLIIKLDRAPDAASYQAALRELYTAVVPPEESRDLELELAVHAQRPGDASFAVVADGAELITGTNVYFTLRTSKAAHVYLYQEDAQGAVTVLFPHPQIPVANPLPAGTEVRIPPSQAFVVNSKDLGTERVHVAASLAPLGNLQPLLQAAQPSAAALACGTRGLELAAAGGCEGTRGLELPTGADAGSSVHSATAPGDDRIVQVFSFQHPR
jgi:hypothetical protein